MLIDRVISVCSAADVVVWSFAAPRILENISAKQYLVIVPDDDVVAFKCNSPGAYEIVPESLLVTNLKSNLLARLPDRNRSRYGWYLQQFIKLRAIESLEGGSTGLIWDADTVPLRPLEFFKRSHVSGKVVAEHYVGRQIHAPYFEVAEKVTGVVSPRNHSFIAQCMPLTAEWARSFFSCLQSLHQKKWEEVLLTSIDFGLASGFSEYETLGTFFSSEFPGHFVPTKRRWLRFGNQRIGTVQNLNDARSKFLLRGYDFASFERWEQPWSLARRLLWEVLPKHRISGR